MTLVTSQPSYRLRSPSCTISFLETHGSPGPSFQHRSLPFPPLSS